MTRLVAELFRFFVSLNIHVEADVNGSEIGERMHSDFYNIVNHDNVLLMVKQRKLALPRLG